MLTTWSINNFKSYREKLSIPLAPINIIAGANSSGKSSIIQSVLLLKQTLQYGSANRPLTLNGPLLRLGGFNDVRNFDADGDDLRLSMEFSFSAQELKNSTSWTRNLTRYQHLGSRADALVGLSLDVAFGEKAPGIGAVPAATNLTPIVTEANVRVTKRVDGATVQNYADIRRRMPALSDDEEAPFQYWRYEAELDSESRAIAFSDKPSASLSGGMYQYFIPAWVAVNFDEAARIALRTIDGIFERHSTLTWSAALDDETVGPKVIDVINKFLVSNGEDPIPENERVLATLVRDRLAGYVRPANLDVFADRRELPGLTLLDSLKDQVAKASLEETISELTVEFESPPVMSIAKDYIQEFFKSGVRYLGPLRDSPRPVYQLEALESTTDVGYRGEHTAAILDLNSSRRISYHSPPVGNPGDEAQPLLRPSSGSLHDAVVEWLTYLGVATEVATTDAGVFGNRLQVATSSLGRLHDLTNVGVGVSQVLPIVVMALLAPKGSFLIFEQPELHLHPKVQARLADFFISLALDSKQMLLETHSEYLIDRFRLRIALADDDSIRPIVNMMFSEKTENQSSLRKISVNEYGAIEDWPKDFFEQSDKDVGRILRAAAKKRADRFPPKATPKGG